jgi:hypothetical protein
MRSALKEQDNSSFWPAQIAGGLNDANGIGQRKSRKLICPSGKSVGTKAPVVRVCAYLKNEIASLLCLGGSKS